MIPILRKHSVAQFRDKFIRFVLPILILLILIFPTPGQTAGWTNTSPMAKARSDHTATLLPNGKVLVAGGWDGSTYSTSAELYNPVTENWSPTGNMGMARSGHTATLLPNGKVLVAGGADNSAELYDWAMGTWSPTGNMGGARQGHTATLLLNGKVLVVGGTGDYITYYGSSAELYDPAAGTWNCINYCSGGPGYIGHTATLIPSGKVLVAGGYYWDYNINYITYSTDSSLYDPITQTWNSTYQMNTPGHTDHTATLLLDGKVLVVGGYYVWWAAEIYNPAYGTWGYTGNSLAMDRRRHTATLLRSGKVLVAGGYSSWSGMNSTELYHPGLRTWSASALMAKARSGHTATLLPNGKVLVAGGADNSAELYEEGNMATMGQLQLLLMDN